MSYLIERRSDTSDLRRWSVSGGVWASEQAVSGVIAPQWDPATGRMEAVIPISAVTSGTPAAGTSWANLLISLCSYDPVTMIWKAAEILLLRYRLSSPGQPWIYGNIEQ